MRKRLLIPSLLGIPPIQISRELLSSFVHLLTEDVSSSSAIGFASLRNRSSAS